MPAPSRRDRGRARNRIGERARGRAASRSACPCREVCACGSASPHRRDARRHGLGLAAWPGAGGPHVRPSQPTRRSHRERVLVISLPDVDWSNIAASELPNLRRAVRAVGDRRHGHQRRAAPEQHGEQLRVARRRVAVVASPATSGQGFGVDELFGRDSGGGRVPHAHRHGARQRPRVPADRRRDRRERRRAVRRGGRRRSATRWRPRT